MVGDVSRGRAGAAWAVSATPATPAPTVNGRPVVNRTESDPFVRALAQYFEALHRRYPGGPAQMRRKGLADRANMLPVNVIPRSPAA